MDKNFLINAFGFGILLWIIGFALGMMLFPFVPVAYIGLPILAIMTPVTFFVAYKRFRSKAYKTNYYLAVAAVWLLIALLFDYIFLVIAFNAQNYYDADIMVYYILAFAIPAAVGIKFGRK